RRLGDLLAEEGAQRRPALLHLVDQQPLRRDGRLHRRVMAFVDGLGVLGIVLLAAEQALPVRPKPAPMTFSAIPRPASPYSWVKDRISAPALSLMMPSRRATSA